MPNSEISHIWNAYSIFIFQENLMVFFFGLCEIFLSNVDGFTLLLRVSVKLNRIEPKT